MFVKLAATLALAATAMAQTFSIATAAIVQCQPVSLTWTGGVSPFILAAIPGGQTSAAAITTVSTSISGSPYTWNVDVAAGTYITLKLTGADGNIAYSSALTVQAGSSNSCLNASASTSGIATTGVITTTGSGSATLSATTAVSGTTSTTSLARSSMSSAAAASMSSASSAAGSSSSTPVSSGGASGTSAAAASASSSKSAALGGAVAGVPAIAAGVLGGLAFLF